jgi:hypothetical protein
MPPAKIRTKFPTREEIVARSGVPDKRAKEILRWVDEMAAKRGFTGPKPAEHKPEPKPSRGRK